MDLELIAIIISIVVLVFQIMTLVLIAGMKKSQGSIKTAPAPLPERERGERRDNEFRRHERRPYQDNRPRQQPQQQPQQQPAPPAAALASSASNESVDKSLRDINLRLKNAERDQENARRRMSQGGFPQDQQRGSRDRGDRFDRGDRGERDHRGDRDHRGGRDNRGNRHDRDRDRGRGRGNWQDRDRDRDRNRQGGQYGQQPGTPAPASAPEGDQLFEKKDFPAPEMQMNPVTEAPVTATPDLAPADYSADESLEHGRKIIVKRRMLQGETAEAGAEASGDSPNSTESAPAPVAVSSPEEETTMGSEPGQEGEITFGRRKAL